MQLVCLLLSRMYFRDLLLLSQRPISQAEIGKTFHESSDLDYVAGGVGLRAVNISNLFRSICKKRARGKLASLFSQKAPTYHPPIERLK